MTAKRKKKDKRATSLEGYGPRELLLELLKVEHGDPQITVAGGGKFLGALADRLVSDRAASKTLRAVLHLGYERKRKGRSTV